MKTLKDIEFPLGNNNLSKDKEAVNRFQLRKEAKKWIEILSEKGDEDMDSYCLSCEKWDDNDDE